MKKIKDIKWNFRLIIILALAVILLSIIMVGIFNRDNIMSILGNSMQKENENEDQTLEFISYKIYDNKDKEHVKVIVSINSENGIEYVKRTDGTIVYANGKNTVGLDYIVAVNVEEQVVVKEIGKEEVTEKILLTEIGTEELPITISNADQLLNIQKNTDKLFKDDILRKDIHYKVVNNIDLSGVEWTPIGTQTKPFEGIFDGNRDEYVISNLSYTDNEKTNVGLFGYSTGTLKNVKLDNCEVTGKENVGVLLGTNTGTIKNVQITNSRVNGTTNTGILIGNNTGNVTISEITSANVTGVTNTGILIGYNTGKLDEGIIIQGEVTATGDCTGGVAGNSTREIVNAVADVTVNGKTNVGGIVGYATNTVSKNTVTGTVIATGNNCGGIIGYVVNNTISENNSRATISGVENVGGCIGLIGASWGGGSTVINNKLSGTITGQNNIGGAIGHISADYAGFNITKNYTTTNINATGNNIGGIIGYSVVNMTGYNNTASLTVSESYSNGRIETEGENVGGIIGYAYQYVSGSGGDGRIYLNIENSFFIGEVVGKQYCGGIGGFINIAGSRYLGRGYTTIKNNYVAGVVNATEGDKEPLYGKFSWSVTQGGGYWISDDNYFVPEKTGLTASTYGTSKNLANMYSQSEFPNWDFENIWTIEEGLTMPYLKNLDKPEGVNK